ncbi:MULTISPECIES: site-specific integrase [unclassified Streptomyces]|uniref:tyrosine-type recombinase/integrase n=1 Tax=unclassified Streptomyces TaxID=2593676 RepID=UPI0033C07F63
MPARAKNNPRQIRIKACGCKHCTEKFRPDSKATRKDCTGPWQARYRDPAGRQRSKNFKGKNAKAKAEAHLDSMRDKVRTGSFVDLDRGKLTVDAWHEKWRVTQRIGENTGETAGSVWLNHVQPYFGSWTLVSIGNLDVEEWIAKLTKVVGKATIDKAFQMLDRMMTAAVRDRRIAHNPCDGVRLPKAEPKHPDDMLPPTYDQLADIRSHMPEHHHPMLIFAEETGLRWGELVGLRLCHVDFKAGCIQVRETVIQVHGKPQRKRYPKSTASCRTVPLSARAARILKKHLEQNPAAGTRTSPESGMHPEELVFRSPRAGEKLKGKTVEGVLGRSNFWRLWNDATEAAGVARRVKNPTTGRVERWPHVHDVRHAFASRLHANGVPEADAQRILGHERGAKITWLYTHARADSLTRVRDALDGDQLSRGVS